LGIRKWIGSLQVSANGSLRGCDHVTDDVKEVLFKALKNAATPPGFYRAYIIVKLGGSILQLSMNMHRKKEAKVVKVDIHRTLFFDGEHADTLQQMLKEGKDMEAVKNAKVVPVVRHPEVGLTLPGGPNIGVKLKPDPFGFHA
jgi:hypothetical protein